MVSMPTAIVPIAFCFWGFFFNLEVAKLFPFRHGYIDPREPLPAVNVLYAKSEIEICRGNSSQR